MTQALQRYFQRWLAPQGPLPRISLHKDLNWIFFLTCSLFLQVPPGSFTSGVGRSCFFSCKNSRTSLTSQVATVVCRKDTCFHPYFQGPSGRPAFGFSSSLSTCLLIVLEGLMKITGAEPHSKQNSCNSPLKATTVAPPSFSPDLNCHF